MTKDEGWGFGVAMGGGWDSGEGVAAHFSDGSTGHGQGDGTAGGFGYLGGHGHGCGTSHGDGNGNGTGEAP